MDPEEEVLVKRCTEIFSDEAGPYQIARQLSVKILRETRSIDEEALVDFRKTLNSLGEFFVHLNIDEITDAEKVLDEIETKLQETSCQLAERRARYHYNRVKKNLPYSMIIYKILLLDAPDVKPTTDTIETRLDMAHDDNPTEWEHAVDRYDDAAEIAEGLADDLPSKSKVRRLILSAILSIISVIGATAGILSYTGTTLF